MIWRFSDVDDNKEYRLHLCASKEGKRFFRLITIGSEDDITPPPVDVYFITALAPNDLLRRRDLISIAELVPLVNGQPFFVDAHNMWLTASEVQQKADKVGYDKFQWVTGAPPIFVPK